MDTYSENTLEYADFMFERQKVVCYGMKNNAGGATTILNFPSRALAAEFADAFLHDRAFEIMANDAQIICMAEYDRVMRLSGDDPRVRFLNYCRDYMMGTLAHVS